MLIKSIVSPTKSAKACTHLGINSLNNKVFKMCFEKMKYRASGMTRESA
jgi:hypothetical protein